MTLKIKGRKLPRLPQKRRNKHFSICMHLYPVLCSILLWSLVRYLNLIHGSLCMLDDTSQWDIITKSSCAYLIFKNTTPKGKITGFGANSENFILGILTYVIFKVEPVTWICLD